MAGMSGALVVGGNGLNRLCACLSSVAWSSAPSLWETPTTRSAATSTATMAIDRASGDLPPQSVRSPGTPRLVQTRWIAFHVNAASLLLDIVDDPPRMHTESSPHMDRPHIRASPPRRRDWPPASSRP